MQKIRVEEAVGKALCHDLTRIVRDAENPAQSFKGAQFKKGYVIKDEDIPMLLSMGKEHVFVWARQEGFLHEEAAAERLDAISRGVNISHTGPREGKIEHYAEVDGLFRVDVDCLEKINSIDGVVIVTRRNNSAVKKGELLAGMKVIPLTIDEKIIEEAESIAADVADVSVDTGALPKLLNVIPYSLASAAIITTGSEVSKGIIKDTFTPVVKEKLSCFGVRDFTHKICDDSLANVRDAIEAARLEKPDIILCTGGMSVDPDDNTPGAIKAVVASSGGCLVSYGAPVFPGAMFLLAYLGDGTPVLGLPGCVMFANATIFDILLPRLAARVKITKAEITRLWHGSLCLKDKGCPPPCHFPHCGFGA
jgi:hypothetical protein